MITKISQIAPVLPVSDVKAAIDWYGRALGFEPGHINREEGDVSGASWNYALLDKDDSQLHLARTVVDDATLSSPANCYLFVSDMKALHAHLAAMGANVSGVQEMPWGSAECWLHDPDGNRLVLSAPL